MRTIITQRFARRPVEAVTYTLDFDGDVTPQDIDERVGRLDESTYITHTKKTLGEWLAQGGLILETITIKIVKEDER
jgi:hypothetical protein